MLSPVSRSNSGFAAAMVSKIGSGLSWSAHDPKAMRFKTSLSSLWPDAAPLAKSYSTTTDFSGPNTFLRFDYHLNGNNQVSFRWTREQILTERDSIEDDKGLLDNARFENVWSEIFFDDFTYAIGVGFIGKYFQRLYERHLAFIFPANVFCVLLKAVK